MSYTYTKLMKLGPVDGFIIHTPDDRQIKDTHPQTIVRELNRLNDRIKRLEEAGNELHDGWRGNRNNMDKYLKAWRKAKEDKL